MTKERYPSEVLNQQHLFCVKMHYKVLKLTEKSNLFCSLFSTNFPPCATTVIHCCLTMKLKQNAALNRPILSYFNVTDLWANSVFKRHKLLSKIKKHTYFISHVKNPESTTVQIPCELGQGFPKFLMSRTPTIDAQ